MASISAIRDALADTIDEIPGLRVYAYIPDSISAPAAVIIPDQGAPTAMGRGNDTLVFRVRVAVEKVSDRSANDLLDDYLASTGSRSLRAQLHATPGLGISGTHARWAGWENYGDHIWNDMSYLGADVLVTVESKGDA